MEEWESVLQMLPLLLIGHFIPSLQVDDATK